MTTAEELKDTFSFIGPFESETVLEPYGDNALPLFAVGLHLGSRRPRHLRGRQLNRWFRRQESRHNLHK